MACGASLAPPPPPPPPISPPEASFAVSVCGCPPPDRRARATEEGASERKAALFRTYRFNTATSESSVV